MEKPIEKQKKSLSSIWLLPILAALIGLGMIYNNWRNQGVGIEVSFETAQGLTANKTVVKYRNVDIGLVKHISLSDNQDNIIVNIEIDNELSNLLKPDTQFWVVRPRVSTAGITGIGTLLSGGYIEISPGVEKGTKSKYVGLEAPPLTPPNADGIHLVLESGGGKPLVVGSAVIYRGFRVGKVESFEFDPLTRLATYRIFIKAPYDKLVTTSTIFWNASGFTLTANAEGVKLDMASLGTLIDGGVEFDEQTELGIGKSVTSNQVFRLYDSEDGLDETREYKYFEYLVLAEDSVGGLYAGAPVEYLGIRVGTVIQPFLTVDTELEGIAILQEDPRIPILIHIEPERAYKSGNVDDANLEKFIAELEQNILKGLFATVQSANLLTGSLKISLNPNGKPITQIEEYGPYKVIPSQRGSVASITDQVQSILAKLESLPLDDTLSKAGKTIGSADKALITFEESMTELRTTLKGLQPDSQIYRSLNQSMQELQITLKGLQPESPIYETLNDSMQELQNTLQSIKPLLKDVSNKPSSLIFSKPHKADEEPKAGGNDD